MKNVSNKSCRETQNTHFTFHNFFFFWKILRLWDMEKCGTAGQVTDDNMALAHCMLDTHSGCNTSRLSTATMVATNAPQCYVLRTMSVLLLLASGLPRTDWLHFTLRTGEQNAKLGRSCFCVSVMRETERNEKLKRKLTTHNESALFLPGLIIRWKKKETAEHFGKTYWNIRPAILMDMLGLDL
jgi:hypothetical protein